MDSDMSPEMKKIVKQLTDSEILPVQLTQQQVFGLIDFYGDDWFDELGFSISTTERSYYDPKRTHRINFAADKLRESLVSGSTPPDQLEEQEVDLLNEIYGVGWFYKFGFTDKTYKHSPFDQFRKQIPVMIPKNERQKKIREEYEKAKKDIPVRVYTNWANAVKLKGDIVDQKKQ